MAVDSFDRVLIAGHSQRQENGESDFAVARLTASGALDTSFDADGKQTIDFGLYDGACGVAVDSLGRVVVAGITQDDSYSQFAVARLTPDGALDISFDADGKQTIDFGSNTGAHCIAVDTLGRVVVAGSAYDGLSDDFAVARLTASGELDTSFDGDGKQTIDFGPYARAHGVVVDSLGHVVVAGITHDDSYSHFAVARLTAAGALDISFDADGRQTIDFGSRTGAHGVTVDTLGRVVVAGSAYVGTFDDFAVARLTASGDLDTSFDSDGKQTIDFGPSVAAHGVAVDSVDRVVIAGYLAAYHSDFAIVRLAVSGALDVTFDADCKQTTELAAGSLGKARSVVVDSLGRTVVAGFTGTQWISPFGVSDFAIVRYTSAGILDYTFGGSGIVTIDFGGSHDGAYGVAVDSLNRVVVAGGSNSDFAVARLTAEGALDTSFDDDGKLTIDFGAFSGSASGVAVDSNGRVLVAGTIGNASSSFFAIARLTSAGVLDPFFDADGKQTFGFGNVSEANCVTVDSLDRVVVAGFTGPQQNEYAVARLTAFGDLDTSFDADGKQSGIFGAFGGKANGVAVDSLDRVIVAGVTAYGSSTDFAMARLTATGALDANFDGGGRKTFSFGAETDWAHSVTVDSLDRAVVAGYTSNVSSSEFAVARLTADGVLDASFDADGKQTIDFGSPYTAYAVAVDLLGRVLVAGTIGVASNQQSPGRSEFAVARLTGDAATVTATTINTGAAQRSRVTILTITFSAHVTFTGAIGNAFRLKRDGGGDVIFDANANVVNGVTVVTLNKLSGAETQFGSLRDGRYTLTALASQISSGGQQMATNYTFGEAQGLFRSYGDMNGDRRVDISDFGFISLAFLQAPNYNAALDFNNDGRIDIADFGQFNVRFFTTLP